MTKVYLGDGVYLEFDGRDLVLTTENGIQVTNRIVLEPEVYQGLLLYVGQVQKQKYQHSEYEILETMHQYGGGFVKQLANLYRLADTDNQRKLEEAFRSYFVQYDEMAVTLNKRVD